MCHSCGGRNPGSPTLDYIDEVTETIAFGSYFSMSTLTYYAAVVEITKTPDRSNQVVSAFLIDPKTYKKMYDISGGTAP
jgi:hypothetical protein